MRKIKRPYKNNKLHSGDNNLVKKSQVKDSRLHLCEGKQKDGAFPVVSIIAPVAPTLISKLFGEKKRKK